MSGENPYLDLLNTEEQRVATTDSPNAAPSKNPYLDTLESEEALKRTQQRAVLRTAVPVNPDEAAQAKKLAAKRGMPDDVVLRNLQDVQMQDAVDRADDRLLTSPVLAERMRQLPFARVAHDNVENLANIEARIKQFGELKSPDAPVPGVGSILTGLGRNFVGGARMANEGLSMQVGDALGLPIDQAQRRYAQEQARVDASTPAFESETARGIYGGGASTLRVLPGVAASILSRSPVPALAAMGAQTESEAYGKYRTRGATPGEALAGAAGEGAVEVATELLPMGFLVQRFGKVGAKEFLAGLVGRELPSEQAATFLQDAIDTAVANPDKTWGEFWQERPAAAYQTLLATLVQSGVMGGASSVARRLADRGQQQAAVEQDNQALTDLLKLAERDKLRERDPQAFAEVVQAAAEQHAAPTEVFIDATALVETLAQSGMTPEQIEQALPSAREQLAPALAAGGDVAVPVGEFAALIGGSGMESQILQHVRTSAEALSQADTKLLGEIDLKAEGEQVGQEQAAVNEVAGVRAALLDQLNEAGRFSPAVNAAYADSVTAFYTTQAERLGITPKEMAERYPLNVRAAGVFGESLEQSRAATDTPEFRNWFGDSKVREPLQSSKERFEDKPPMVVYHGTRSNFDAFLPVREGNAVDMFGGEGKVTRRGIFFAENPDFAATFARQSGQGNANVMPVYLNIRNPLYLDEGFTDEVIDALNAAGLPNTQRLRFRKPSMVWAEFDDEAGEAFVAAVKRAGYDGIYMQESGVGLDENADQQNVWVAFDPQQIKSAIGNRGTFDPNDANILNQGDAPRGEWSRLNAELNALLDANPETAAAYRALNRVRLEAQAADWSEEVGDKVTAAEEAFFALPNAERVSELADQRNAATGTAEAAPEAKANDPYGPAPFGLKGTFSPSTNTITLLAQSDLSTFLHETGHFYLEVLADMASQPDAPAAVVGDMNKVLEWFGVADLATWRAMSLDQRRDSHEKFARGFEAYLFEGKAPGSEMGALFGRFRAWLVSIYKSVRSLNVEINDDIRRVFDRLLASDEAIRQAEATRAYAPLFADPAAMEKAGVDPAAYQALGAEATAEAVDQMAARSMRDMRWLANARNRALKALQKDAAETRKAVEAEVRAEVGRMPVYAAENFLRRGVLEITDPNNAQRRAIDATQGMNTKLDLAVLKEMYGDAPAAPWRYLATGKTGLATKKDGIHPDIAAEIFGYPSGDALVRELLAAEPQAQVIEGMTDQRMLERYGELSSPDALERAAEQAIRNEARGKFIATELSALNKALGPVRVLVAAAKQFAEQVIGRKVITDIRPHVFAAAETRAAKLAEKALGKSTEEAATHKRNQLLNHFAARYAHEAQREVERIRAFFGKVANTPDDKAGKTRDMDVVNAARAVLAAYGVGRRGEAASEYLQRVRTYDPLTAAALQPSIDAALANAKPLDTLTLDELRALNDEIASLWHLAKRSKQMEVDGALIDREAVQEALGARLAEIGVPDRIPGEGSAVTPGEARLNLLRSFRAAARRVESWVGSMDGADMGPFRRYVWQTIKEPADAYRADKAKYLKQFRDLLKPIAPTLKRRLIDAPELGYTFGKDEGGVGLSELLHAIGHTGNESNKRKLLLGRQWAEEMPDGTLDTRRWDSFIARVAREGVLVKAHFDFVQGVWDLHESMKPLAQKTHRDVFGKYFAEITAEPVTTPFGQYAGGYMPAIADPRVVSDAKTRALMEEENSSMAFAFPATNRGFTKGRTEYNKPLLLDLRTVAQHIDKVLLFSHMERPLRDLRRVLASKEVGGPLNRIDPTAFDGILTPWLNRSARQQVETPVAGAQGLMRFFAVLRARAGMQAMFGNIVNAAQQVTGLSIAAVKVKPKYLLGGMADYLAHPRKVAAAVAEASPYMASRMDNEVAAMNDAIKDILIDPTLMQSTQAWFSKHAYFLQSAVDNVISPVVWLGARAQALEQGMSDKDAVRMADAAVRETQGSTLPEDISRIETGNAFVRMFTQFAGYFNMQANLLGTEFSKIPADMGLRKGAARGLYVLTLGFLVPAWVSELIVQVWRGGPDDEDKDGEYLDDWLAAIFGMSTIRGGLAMVPVAGPLINTAINMTNGKPYDDRLSTAPAISMLESAVRGAVVAAPKILGGDEIRARDVRDVGTLIGMTVGLPTGPAAKPLAYGAEVNNGRVQPAGPIDAARGALTGTASPGSR